MKTKWKTKMENLDAASLETSFGQTGGFVGLVLEEAKTSENRKQPYNYEMINLTDNFFFKLYK